MTRSETIHASAVLLGETGVLIRGGAGSGKSTLVLALIESDPEGGVRLIADDRVKITAVNGRLLAEAPHAIAGLVESRGAGIFSYSWIRAALIRVVVDLHPADTCPRLPEEGDAVVSLRGIDLPRFFIPTGTPAAAEKVRAALGAHTGDAGVRPIVSCFE